MKKTLEQESQIESILLELDKLNENSLDMKSVEILKNVKNKLNSLR